MREEQLFIPEETIQSPEDKYGHIIRFTDLVYRNGARHMYGVDAAGKRHHISNDKVMDAYGYIPREKNKHEGTVAIPEAVLPISSAQEAASDDYGQLIINLQITHNEFTRTDSKVSESQSVRSPAWALLGGVLLRFKEKADAENKNFTYRSEQLPLLSSRNTPLFDYPVPLPETPVAVHAVNEGNPSNTPEDRHDNWWNDPCEAVNFMSLAFNEPSMSTVDLPAAEPAKSRVMDFPDGREVVMGSKGRILSEKVIPGEILLKINTPVLSIDTKGAIDSSNQPVIPACKPHSNTTELPRAYHIDPLLARAAQNNTFNVGSKGINRTVEPNTNARRPERRRKLVLLGMIGLVAVGALWAGIRGGNSVDSEAKLAVPTSIIPQLEPVVTTISPIESTPVVTVPATTIDTAPPVVTSTPAQEVIVPDTTEPVVDTVPEVTPPAVTSVPELPAEQSADQNELPQPEIGTAISFSLNALPYTNALNLGIERPNAFIQRVLDEYNMRTHSQFVWNHSDGMFYAGHHILSPAELAAYNEIFIELYQLND